MRFAFQEKPYDLVAVFVASAILAPLALLELAGPARIALGLLFILFVPGYVLVAALFPGRGQSSPVGEEEADEPDESREGGDAERRKGEIDWIERIALSVGLSIAVVALIGLALNFTPWGIFLEPVLASLLLFTYGLGALAYWRRMKLLPMQRLSLSIEIPKLEWSSSSRADKIATVALAASLVFAAGTVAFVIVTPRPAERFTEFYILNATGVAGGYPTNLTVDEPGTINFTVHNREFADVAYEIRIYRATMQEYFNASANRTELRELSRTYVSALSLELGNDGYWNRSYTFNFSSPGIYRLYFNLYKLPNTLDAYRYLFLTVRVLN